MRNRDELSERLITGENSLLRRWVARRERKGSPVSCWPGIGHRIERHGLSYDLVAAGFDLSRGTSVKGFDDVDVMGQAFGDLPAWKQIVIWLWVTVGLSESTMQEWKECERYWRLSEGKLHNILIDLQTAATKRGLWVGQ